MSKTLLVAGSLLVFAVVGVAIAMASYAQCITADTTVLALASLVLVAVTTAYVAITSDIARANAETVAATRQLADETTTLARETARMAEAAVSQAEATAGTLSHLQRPVLVMRIHGKPDERGVRIQIQNVGEGAAIWPQVYTEDEECVHNRLFPGPHIFPPRQFEETGEVLECQRFDVPFPTTGECFLVVRCLDPRTGGALRREWRVWMRDPSAWFADPVTETEDTGSGQTVVMVGYRNILRSVKELYGESVRTCWVAEVKELNDLPVGQVGDLGAEVRMNPCPERVRPMIEDAMRRLGMLKQNQP